MDYEAEMERLVARFKADARALVFKLARQTLTARMGQAEKPAKPRAKRSRKRS